MNKFIVADAQECIGCHACELACAVAHNHGIWPERSAFHPRIRVIGRGNENVAVTCRHCNDAPCVSSCPVSALTFRDSEVKLDAALCIGCKECVLACPFGAIDMVPAEPGQTRSLAQKCDLCEQTSSGEPACVAHCPTQALSLMDVSAITRLRQTRQRASATGEYPRPARRSVALLDKPLRKGAGKLPADERRAHFDEIYHALSDTQAQQESERCLYCAERAWCNWTCPLHNAIPDFIRLVKEGQIEAAAELCHQSSSLPEICGRLCPQERLCEGACTLHDRGGAVTIGNLERYITDTALARGWHPATAVPAARSEKVAVIGAGPAGLGCADILARSGVQVEVFDTHPEIGGLLTFGIPPFKLDKQILSRRRELFSEMGIRFRLGCEVGKDINFDSLLAEYDAVFLGVGTYGLMRAGLEHEDAPGVVQALPFLIASTRRVMGLEDDPRYPWIDLEGKNVVVLGGGDTAMDCVRTSLRRGAASVTCAYRRDEASMPGSKKEVLNAREEGAVFQFNVQPEYIARQRKGRVSGIGMVRTQMGAPGPDGRRRPQRIPDSQFELPADVLIMAFGFQPHPMPWLRQHGVSFDDWGLIETGKENRASTQTSNPKVYAGGDAVHGADLVVTAMAAGRQAAREMLTQFDAALTQGE